MFNDHFDLNRMETERVAIGDSQSEIHIPKFKGEIRDTFIFHEAGRHEVMPGMFVDAHEGMEWESPVGHNLVVDACSKLIAALLKGQAGYAGIQYWEVGSGNSSWNDNSPPAPAPGDSGLLVPVMRKAIAPTDITFIDGTNANSASPTNRLQIIVTFTSTEANGYLREFGLFGGNATAALGSGVMINRKTHGVIFKTSALDLKRTLRMTF